MDHCICVDVPNLGREEERKGRERREKEREERKGREGREEEREGRKSNFMHPPLVSHPDLG